MRTESTEFHMNRSPRPWKTHPQKSGRRTGPSSALTSETVDAAFATLGDTLTRADAPVSTATVPQNRAIVVEIAGQLDALDQQRRQLATLLDQLQDVD